MMQGRNYVIPDDVKAIAPDVMRHRISISYKAEADEKSSDHIVNELLGIYPLRQINFHDSRGTGT